MEVKWINKAKKQLAKVKDTHLRNKIFNETENLKENFENNPNVKNLVNHKYDFRLRVENYRVLFNIVNGDVKIIIVQEVKKRNENTY